MKMSSSVYTVEQTESDCEGYDIDRLQAAFPTIKQCYMFIKHEMQFGVKAEKFVIQKWTDGKSEIIKVAPMFSDEFKEKTKDGWKIPHA